MVESYIYDPCDSTVLGASRQFQSTMFFEQGPFTLSEIPPLHPFPHPLMDAPPPALMPSPLRSPGGWPNLPGAIPLDFSGWGNQSHSETVTRPDFPERQLRSPSKVVFSEPRGHRSRASIAIGVLPTRKSPSHRSRASTALGLLPTRQPRGHSRSQSEPSNDVREKRPRRRKEEIVRLYTCGFGDCDKAYGTLNHLNIHVRLMGHGLKRLPEEFKEIRELWKRKLAQEVQPPPPGPDTLSLQELQTRRSRSTSPSKVRKPSGRPRPASVHLAPALRLQLPEEEQSRTPFEFVALPTTVETTLPVQRMAPSIAEPLPSLAATCLAPAEAPLAHFHQNIDPGAFSSPVNVSPFNPMESRIVVEPGRSPPTTMQEMSLAMITPSITPQLHKATLVNHSDGFLLAPVMEFTEWGYPSEAASEAMLPDLGFDITPNFWSFSMTSELFEHTG